MEIDNNKLEIFYDMSYEEVVELKNSIKSKLEQIEIINVIENENGNKGFKTSALLQLLVSIKKTKPSISIPIIDKQRVEINGFGNFNWKI